MSTRVPVSVIMVAVVFGILGAPQLLPAQCEWEETDKLVASDADNADWAGGSVAISGNIAVVSAHGDDEAAHTAGAAYVHRLDGGQWVEEAKLIASDATANARFGRSVAIDGDVIVVGAPNQGGEVNGGEEGIGAAYVYRFDGIAWVEEATLHRIDRAPGDRFGASVSICGDVIVVGIPETYHDGPGAVNVYRYDGAAWNVAAELLASDGEADDKFGNSVWIDGKVIVIGALHDDDQAWSAGSAYVYRFDGVAWNEEQKLTDSDGGPGDYYGFRVSVSGDVVVIGSRRNDGVCPENPVCDSGAAYVYHFDGTSWIEAADLASFDIADDDRFGYSVVVQGDTIVIGALNEGNTGNSNDDGPGAAYLYRFDGSDWIELAKFVASDGAENDSFGVSVAVDGQWVVVGALFDDIDCPESSECNNGSAYVFDLSEFCGGCPADFDGDGAVGAADLAILLGTWGPCEACPADFNGDGEVNAFDLAQLLGDWGLCQ